jgi:hypothetical protein
VRNKREPVDELRRSAQRRSATVPSALVTLDAIVSRMLAALAAHHQETDLTK